MRKTILLVSWVSSLAMTREMLLRQAGYAVISAFGKAEAEEKCHSKADLLVLGHSVPRPEKRELIACYRKSNIGPVLSLLAPNQQKLTEADFGVEAINPDEVIDAVHGILGD